MYNNLYCKVYVDTNLSYEEIFSKVMDFVAGKKESFRYVITEWCEMFIQKNTEYSEEQYLNETDDFVYWKYYFDIEPIRIDEDTYIKRIYILLNYLRGFCNGVVAACDFEDELKEIGERKTGNNV